LRSSEVKTELVWAADWSGFGLGEPFYWLAVHEVGAREPGEAEQARDRALRGMGEAQEQEGNQRHSELNTDGVFASAE